MDIAKLNEKILSNGMTRIAHLRSLQEQFHQYGICYNGNFKKWENIPYGTDSEKQKYNVYTPKNPGKHPTILYVHGGAWMIGDRADGGVGMALPLVAHGYTIITVGYRLSDEAVYPESVWDVVRGFEAAMERAEEFGIDPENLACIGGSAGTNMAILGAMWSKYRSAFKAAFLRCPLLKLSTIREDYAECGFARSKIFGYPDEDTSIEALFLGGTCKELPEAYDNAYPLHYVDKEVCPQFLLMHGLVDKAAPYPQSVRFVNDVKAKCGEDKAELILYPETGHDHGLYDDPQCFETVLAFLDKYLRNK